MSEKSAAPAASTTKTLERDQEQHVGNHGETSYKVITNYSKDDEALIEIQSSSVQEAKVVKMANNISYGSLQKPPVCDAKKYGDCIKPVDDNNRPCTLYSRCKRDNH